MFNIVEKNQKFVKSLMIFIAITFVMWGVGSYLGMIGDDAYIAKVGSTKIYEKDINNVLEQNKDAGDKMQVLISLINRQLILENSNKNNMEVTKIQIQNEIASIPAFQESGVFSYDRFQKVILSNRLNIKDFEHNLSEQILIKQYVDLFNDSYFSSNIMKNKLAQIFSRQRSVLEYKINPQSYFNQVLVKPEEINQYYLQNKQKLFTKVEKVKLAYLNLTQDNVLNNIHPTDKVIDDYILSHKSSLVDKYVDASHILFAVPQNSSKSYQENQYNKAKSVLVELQQSPNKFKQLAKKYSDDKQSAKNGGDLGRFKGGIMVKEFDSVVFEMKPNQISDIIKTQFGYHIIRLNKIEYSTSDELKQKAIAIVKKQQLLLKWQQIQDQLNDLTYNNPKTLDVAANKLDLKIINSEWLDKNGNNGLLANKKIQDAVFSNDVLQKGNNSQIVDLGNNNLFVIRVTGYQPVVTESIVMVKDRIINALKLAKATELAYKKGESDIVALKKGNLNLNFANLQKLNLLTQNNGITPEMVRQIFTVDLKHTPQYTGGINANGEFIIYKVVDENLDKELLKQNLNVVDNISKNQSMFDFAVYVSSLKNNFKVTYKTDLSKQQNNK
jgi:peptidyl-prolyl cis-trans isomerase D